MFLYVGRKEITSAASSAKKNESIDRRDAIEWDVNVRAYKELLYEKTKRERERVLELE